MRHVRINTMSSLRVGRLHNMGEKAKGLLARWTVWLGFGREFGTSLIVRMGHKLVTKIQSPPFTLRD